MKKNVGQPKSFGKAMFSMAQLCQDYQQIAAKPENEKQQEKNTFKPIKNIAPFAPQIRKVTQPQSLPKPPTKNIPKTINNQSKGVVLKQAIKHSPDQITLNIKKLEKLKLNQQVSSYSKPISNSKQPIQNKHKVLEVSKFIQKPHMQFFYQCHDLRQGGLGDCYLISAISCLANKGNILNRCIQYLPPDLINSTKEFVCHIFDSGSLIDVKVKNQFSVFESNLEPAYVKPIDGDITPMIIEKAYAQVYGGYQNIILGYSCDALRDLSGAPTKYISLTEKDLNEKIIQAFEMGYVLTISSKINTVNEGIHKRHCYVICDYKVHKGVLWLQLRNPTGYTPINPIVKEVTDFKLELLQPNGLQWLPYNYLVNNFEVISSCLIRPKYHYTYKTISSAQLGNSNQKCFMIQTTEVIHGYVTLHQFHSRHLPQTDYTYEVGKVIVARIQRENNNSYKVLETIDGYFNCKQTCTVEINLLPGRYIVYCQINSLHKLVDKSRPLTISFYTSSPQFQLCDVDPVLPDALLINYIKNHEKQFEVTRTEKMVRYFGVLFGYVVILFQNISAYTAYIDILFDVKNVKPETNKIVVEPKGLKLIKNVIGKENNCSHKCSIKVNTVYK